MEKVSYESYDCVSALATLLQRRAPASPNEGQRVVTQPVDGPFHQEHHPCGDNDRHQRNSYHAVPAAREHEMNEIDGIRQVAQKAIDHVVLA